MKNRGFTLIELLAVIAILAVIVVITTPVVLNTIKTSTDKLNENQKLAVENAAREWVLKNVSVDNNNKISGKTYTSVTIKKLQDDHYLDNKESLQRININDMTKAGVCIKVKTSGTEFIGYTYTYKDDVTGTKCA